MFFVRINPASTTGLETLCHLTNISNKCICNVLRACFSDSAYYKHRYSTELEAAINTQIQAEQQASQEYLNIAVTLLHPSVSRLGAGNFFMRMFHEELEHMEDFIQYQIHRGGTPIIQGLAAPTPKPKITLLDAFKQALEMEHCITEQINKLVSTAEKDKDHHCVHFLTKVFLEEQINSIHKLSLHVTQLSSIGEDPDALHQYNLLLLKTCPYQHKSMKK